MIAAAYRYASGGMRKEDMPAEIELINMIDRFGAQAIYGRTLKRSEVRRLMIPERIVNAYQAMSAAEDMDKWIQTHHADWELLDWAAGLERNGE